MSSACVVLKHTVQEPKEDDMAKKKKRELITQKRKMKVKDVGNAHLRDGLLYTQAR
jgi:hypothetical protein